MSKASRIMRDSTTRELAETCRQYVDVLAGRRHLTNNHVVVAGSTRCVLHLFTSRVIPAVGDVVGDGAVEQKDVPLDNGEENRGWVPPQPEITEYQRSNALVPDGENGATIGELSDVPRSNGSATVDMPRAAARVQRTVRRVSASRPPWSRARAPPRTMTSPD